MKPGSIYVNSFYSYEKDYISAEILPYSVSKPGTTGGSGEKQFVNVNLTTFTGCEMGFTSPKTHKLGVNVIVAHTYRRIPSVTMYSIKSGQITGDTLFKQCLA